MSFKQAFDEIFRAVVQSVEENLNAYKNNTLPDSSKPISLQGQGTIPVELDLDGNGNNHTESQQYGAGKTVQCTAWITDPVATYTITIKSSDGGGGHWENVHVNDQLKFEIHTSFWHKTTITVDIHATVANQKGHGQIQYSY